MKYSYIDHLSGITHRTYEGGHGPTFTTKLRGQNLVKDLNARDLGTFHHTCNEAIESANQGELSIDMSKAPKTMQTTIVKIHFKLSNPETGYIFSGSDDKSKGTFKIEIMKFSRLCHYTRCDYRYGCFFDLTLLLMSLIES